MKTCVYFILVISLIWASTTTPAVALAPDGTFDCQTVSQIPQIECEALVALYNSTNGPGWTDKTNWLVTYTPSDWFGVSVYEGHVSSLNLTHNLLTGIIPPEVFNLSFLSYLFLGYNQLSGGIPTEITYLSILQGLYLWGNQLSGSIPPEIGNLTNLASMNLSDNLLEGVLPPELGNLSSLTGLSINANPNLIGPLPPSLINLPLSSFYFDDTRLCEPDDPDFQAWLSSITYLQGTGAICGHPFTCTAVTQISEIECEALVAFYNSTNGDGWNVHNNWLFSNTPSNWTGLLVNNGSVKAIILKANNLFGNIPLEIGHLPGLMYLFLNNNDLRGVIPSTIGNLIDLEYLRLESNRFTGSIPSEIGNLTNLQILWLQNNYLQGDIPAALANLTRLYEPSQPGDPYGLDLDYNYLSIPPDYPNPDNPFHTFLFQKDPDWHLRQSQTKIAAYLPVVIR